MPCDERLELADELFVAAGCEVGLDPRLEQRAAELVEPGDLGLRERVVGELGERLAPPQRQRSADVLGAVLGSGSLRAAMSASSRPRSTCRVSTSSA